MISRIISVDREKRELINRLSVAKADLALFYGDFEDLPSGLTRVTQDVAIIHPPFVFDELEAFWSYGNWNLVGPARLDWRFMDTFRLGDEEIGKAMRNHKVELVVDSFHDNIEWRVCEVTLSTDAKAP